MQNNPARTRGLTKIRFNSHIHKPYIIIRRKVTEDIKKYKEITIQNPH